MKKQKAVKQTIDSPEYVKSIPSEIKNTLVDELGKGMISDFWEQILGSKNDAQKQAKSGDLQPGQEIDFKREKTVLVESGISYSREIIHAEKKIQAQSEQKDRARIQELLIEIKALIGKSKELQIEFKDVQVEQIPQSAGKYHTAFVEWVLSLIRSARERVDTAVSWTNAMKSRKGQKQYWSLFKKHGTSFGLSSERVVATQVG